MNRIYVLLILLIIMGGQALAQVHVRGYYRSNGTYVRPHERTRPNSTVTDNYSYPGNYNPNTGRVTGGSTYSNGYSDGHQNTSSANATVANAEPSTTVYSNGQLVRFKFPKPVERQLIVEGALLDNYIGYGGTVLKQLTKGEKVTLVGVDYDSYRVIHNGSVAYLHYRFIDKDYKTFNSQQLLDEASYLTGDFDGLERYGKVLGRSPLRERPSADSRELYQIPSGTVLKLKKLNGQYWYTVIDGHSGFISDLYISSTPVDKP